jgi:hypothetical protein
LADIFVVQTGIYVQEMVFMKIKEIDGFFTLRNRKEVLANYNITRINIGHQHDRWIELKEGLRVQTHAEGKH